MLRVGYSRQDPSTNVREVGRLFRVVRSNRTEELVEALAEDLRVPLDNPLRPEVVAVQSLGMRTWLGQELARRLGVWANAQFPFPRELIQRLVCAVLGQADGDQDPYQRERLTWAVMACLPGQLDQPGFEPLRDYLAPEDRPLKRYQLAVRIAQVFDQYLVYRPDLLLAWEHDQSPDWQAGLWRSLCALLGGEPLLVRWRRLTGTASGQWAQASGLPQRIALFGISSLPPLYLDVLARVSETIDVCLYLFAPTREFWGDLQDPRTIGRILTGQPGDADVLRQQLHLDEGHPLLASLGRTGRDFAQVLERDVDYQESERDRFVAPGPGAEDNLLGRLQADLFHLRGRPAEGAPAVSIADGDAALLLHACHSPMREVEALHERLREWFEDEREPRLQPHEVLVMTPDIEAYAPLIEAVFSASVGGPPIPYSISDRSLRYDSPVVEALMGLLELASTRLSLGEVFDRLSLAPVRERFGLSSQDLELAQRWVAEAGVRWGIDAEHRRALGLEPFEQNSWRFGLDRLLLGVALPGEERTLFAGCLPYDALEGQQAEVAGRLVDFCERLFAAVDQLGRERSLPDWQTVLLDLLQVMVVDDRDNAYQHQQIRAALTDLVSDAAQAGWDAPLSLEVVKAVLADRFGQTRSVHGFLSGGVTFCNLVPMRSIPFRVICLLGLNDGNFPRAVQKLGFDRIAEHPLPGDRKPRDDDRYAFLEALLAARERLLISYVGQSLQDNAPLPPSVVVSELLDVIAQGLPETGADNRQLVEQRLVVRQPLQPFSPRLFGLSDDRRLVSYQRDHLEGARAVQAGRRPPAPFLDGPLPADEGGAGEIRLDDLKRFFRLPVAYLLERRLGVDLRAEPDQLPVREPIELDGLQRHSLGQWLLDRSIEQDRPVESSLPVLRAKGVLPPGAPGALAFEQLGAQVRELVDVWRAWIGGSRLAPREVRISLPGGRLVGLLSDLWPEAQARITFSTRLANRLVGLWIDHLALLSLGAADLPRTSCLLARGLGKPGPYRFELPEREPQDLLDDLVALFREGQRQSLPLFPESSWAFAERLRKAGQDSPQARADALEAARGKWRSGFRIPGDQDHPAVRRVFGQADPLGAGPDPAGLDFSALAVRVFGPLLDALGRGGPA